MLILKYIFVRALERREESNDVEFLFNNGRKFHGSFSRQKQRFTVGNLPEFPKDFFHHGNGEDKGTSHSLIKEPRSSVCIKMDNFETCRR